MEKIIIHYVDDDAEDIEFFQHAANRAFPDIILYTYTKGDDLLNNLNEKDSENKLVFLDINMPGKNGFDILKEIRNSEPLKRLPVIMYSTSKDLRSVETSKALGANLYAVKPTSFSAIQLIIKEVIAIDWNAGGVDPEHFIINKG